MKSTCSTYAAATFGALLSQLFFIFFSPKYTKHLDILRSNHLPNFISNRSYIGILQAQKKSIKNSRSTIFWGRTYGGGCCTNIILKQTNRYFLIWWKRINSHTEICLCQTLAAPFNEVLNNFFSANLFLKGFVQKKYDYILSTRSNHYWLNSSGMRDQNYIFCKITWLKRRGKCNTRIHLSFVVQIQFQIMIMFPYFVP